MDGATAMDGLTWLQTLGFLILTLIVVYVSWRFTKWIMLLVRRSFAWSWTVSKVLIAGGFGLVFVLLLLAFIAVLTGAT